MKKSLIPAGFLALCLLTTGCAANSDPMASTASPSLSPSAMVSDSPSAVPEATENVLPDRTDEPMTSPNTDGASAAGVATAADARKAVEEIEDELERLSEVKDAEVVLAGNVAAVALQFDSQYQGGVDDRLQAIVQERVDGVISGFEAVAVTDDSDLFDQLRSLGDRLDGEADMSDIQNELNAIVNKITAATV